MADSLATPWPKNIFANNEEELAQELGLRPEVLAFAKLMEAKLGKHDHDRGRQGWKECLPQTLMGAMDWERRELRIALLDMVPDAQKTASECADVANFAMMIADVVGGLKNG